MITDKSSQLIVANHLTEVRPDRYFSVTSVWSLKQQAIVADCKGYVVFFDYDEGKPADLAKAGGVHKDLYDALTRRMEKEGAVAAKWEKEHPRKSKAVL